jgi:parallel beta-helix repeat protein
MKNKNLILAILGILLFGLGVINNNLSDTSFPTETIYEKDRADLISSGFWNLTGSPILIDDSDPSKNWSYTASHYAWCSGSGTLEAPYIVENVTIDGQGVGSCIEIRNSTAFFKVINCTVYNSGSNYLEDGGIKLNNTKNGQIISNNIFNTRYGIYLLYGCYNNIVSFNYGEFSIELFECYNNTISNNNMFGVEFRINLRSNSSYNLITKNVLYGGEYGIISLSLNSNYNVVKNNTIEESTASTAISISDCRNNIILENCIRNIGEAVFGKISIKGGIGLANVDNTIISNNIVANTGLSGIFATGNNNTIEGNEINNNGGYGIWAEGNNNTFSKNSIVNNYIGINSFGQNLVINDNFITLNHHNGIYSGGSCNISGNIITSNGCSVGPEGMKLTNLNNSLIWNNTLTNNYGGGIFLELLCFNNAVYENNITGYRKYNDYGIYVFKSNNNNITKNILTHHCVALYLERSNYSNVIENVMRQNLKCIEEVDCIGNLYRDNSCDLDDIQPAIPGFDIYFLIGIAFLFAVVSVIRKFNRKN